MSCSEVAVTVSPTPGAGQAARLPVAVIGLGDIARKAYLPVLCTEPGLDLHLMTRNREKLDTIGDAYRVEARHTDLEAVIAAGVRAAFVHAPTERHPDIVTRLLTAGIDVLVDKPLSYRLADSRRLVALARDLDRSLAVGFNRRFAPAYTEALRHPRDLVVLQKDRRAEARDVRTIVLDDFIHLVDTLRMLAPAGATDLDVRGRIADGRLDHVVLRLAADGFTGLAVMNRASGSGSEVLQTAGADHRREVVNLTEVIEHDGAPRLRRAGDWEPVGRRRGFEDMCRHFLTAVRAGERLDAEDALITHEWCEQIITRLSTTG
jgi:virulence factor